jgi:predicted phosphoadenosine phosphosulfate sulfurtransferase
MARAAAAAPRALSQGKRPLGIDVLTAARQRVARIFDDFPNVYVSFSGGKDSGAALELGAVEARARGRKLGVLIVDLEAQYQHTIDYLHLMLERHADVIEPYWVCLPIALRNAVSQFQPKWECWDPDERENWVRELPEHPGVVSDPEFFPFFHRGMEFEELVPEFGRWYAEQHEGRLTACIVAIRTQESLNRYRTIASKRKTRHEGLQWTTWIGGPVYNAYPIYDWQTEDDWRYYGREKVPYNRVYDLMHQAGLTIHQARLCQPYGDDQRKGLWLYHILEPKTWGRVVARVQGANFGARYARETGNILGRITITKPDGVTWQDYAEALLDSMPEDTAEHFRDKIAVFINWYAQRGYDGGIIPDEGPMGKGTPSWKRICKTILSFDFYAKGLTFNPPAHHAAYLKYRKRMEAQRREWRYPGTWKEGRGL